MKIIFKDEALSELYSNGKKRRPKVQETLQEQEVG
jgi:hypothetical protein